MFWRSDAREKCRFPDCDYTSLFSDGYLYWSYQTKNHHSNNKAMIEFFFSPLSLFFSLFFSSWKDTKGSKRSDATRERFYVLHVEGRG